MYEFAPDSFLESAFEDRYLETEPTWPFEEEFSGEAYEVWVDDEIEQFEEEFEDFDDSDFDESFDYGV